MTLKPKVIFNFQTRDKYFKEIDWKQKFVWFMARSARNVCILSLFILTGYASAKIYNAMNPNTVYAEKEVVVEVKGHAPIMDKIAQCESGNSHIDKKTGQVLMRANANKTVDTGKYQINSVWYKKASELGLDITKEKDNETMAYWIYENRGTGDWVYSQDCWKK